MARAMPTRAFCPPESWCGKRSSSSSGRPTRSAQSCTRGSQRRAVEQLRQAAQRMRDAVEGGEARVQAVVRILEDDLDVAAQRRSMEVARRDARRSARRRTGCRRSSDRSAGRSCARACSCPSPNSPTRPRLSPARDARTKRRRPRCAGGEVLDRFCTSSSGGVPARSVGRGGSGGSGTAARPSATRSSTRGGRRRRCGNQAARVRMLRRREQLSRRRVLHDRPCSITAMWLQYCAARPRSWVMQDRRHAALGGDAAQQVHHRLLRGDVEAGGRLVGDQQRRLAGDRHGDHDALAHAAGELVRVGVEAALGSRISTSLSSRAARSRASPRVRVRGARAAHRRSAGRRCGSG